MRNVFVGGTHHDAAAPDPAVPLTPEPELFNTGGREVELASSRGEEEVLRLETAARDRLVPWAAGWLSTRVVTGARDVEDEWHRLVLGPQEDSALTGTTASI